MTIKLIAVLQGYNSTDEIFTTTFAEVCLKLASDADNGQVYINACYKHAINSPTTPELQNIAKLVSKLHNGVFIHIRYVIRKD